MILAQDKILAGIFWPLMKMLRRPPIVNFVGNLDSIEGLQKTDAHYLCAKDKEIRYSSSKLLEISV